MSATLGEFVRVMTGGSVVTKDLHTDSLVKIKAAIQKLEGLIIALGQTALKSSALEGQLAAARNGLIEGMAESPTAARYKKLAVVQRDAEAAASAAKKQIDRDLALAKKHKDLATAVLAAIDRNISEVKKLDKPDIEKKVIKNLDALKVRQADAASVTDVSELEQKIDALMDIRMEAKDGGEEVVRKFGDISLEITTLRASLREIKDASLRQSVADALDTCDERLDLAAAGKGKFPRDKVDESQGYTTGSVTVNVGGTKTTMTALELLRALGATAAGFKTALRDPKSDERELMELDGPTKFGEGLTNMNNHVVIFGANHKPISPAEALAIHRYMGPDYGDMNLVSLGRLATDPTDPADVKKKKRLERLNELCAVALKKLPPYPKAAYPTIRAERAWDQTMIDSRYGIGKTFVTGVLWSTGAGSEVDLGKAGPKFTHSIFGKSGQDVAALAACPGEGGLKSTDAPRPGIGKGEVLFPATTKFTVKKRTDPMPAELGTMTLNYTPGPVTYPPPIRTTLREIT